LESQRTVRQITLRFGDCRTPLQWNPNRLRGCQWRL
jgi:hypothetical protein